MAWALQFDGVDDYADSTSNVINASDTYTSITLSALIKTDDAYAGPAGMFAALSSILDVNYRDWQSDANKLRFRFYTSAGSTYVAIPAGVPTGVFTKVTFDAREVGPDVVIEFRLDDAVIHTYTEVGATLSHASRSVWLGNSLALAQYQYFELALDDIVVNKWDATASDHSGSTGQPVLTDTVGGNDATGVNFSPFDASVWADLGGSGETIILDSGSYSISGTDSNLLVSSLISTESGGYSLTGTDTQLKSSLIITTESGVYTLSGSDAEILAAKKVIVETGVYLLSGSDVTLTVTGETGVIITLEPGEYSFTGENKPLYINYIVGAQSANYTINGTELNLLYNRAITIDSGNYGITGTDLAFKTDYVIIPESVNYSLTGKSVTLIYSNEQKQVIGNVTASYKDSGITTNFKENSITVRFN